MWSCQCVLCEHDNLYTRRAPLALRGAVPLTEITHSKLCTSQMDKASPLAWLALSPMAARPSNKYRNAINKYICIYWGPDPRGPSLLINTSSNDLPRPRGPGVPVYTYIHKYDPIYINKIHAYIRECPYVNIQVYQNTYIYIYIYIIVCAIKDLGKTMNEYI